TRRARSRGSRSRSIWWAGRREASPQRGAERGGPGGPGPDAVEELAVLGQRDQEVPLELLQLGGHLLVAGLGLLDEVSGLGQLRLGVGLRLVAVLAVGLGGLLGRLVALELVLGALEALAGLGQGALGVGELGAEVGALLLGGLLLEVDLGLEPAEAVLDAL